MLASSFKIENHFKFFAIYNASDKMESKSMNKEYVGIYLTLFIYCNKDTLN